MISMVKVFIYGTLMRDNSNHKDYIEDLTSKKAAYGSVYKHTSFSIFDVLKKLFK